MFGNMSYQMYWSANIILTPEDDYFRFKIIKYASYVFKPMLNIFINKLNLVLMSM